MIAPGSAEDDLIFDRKRRGSELEIGLAVGEIGFPGDLARVLVGGGMIGNDDARTKIKATTISMSMFLSLVSCPKRGTQP